MTSFLRRRLLLALPILIGVSIVVFITIKMIPGDPVSALLGPNGTPQARAALTARLGLHKALPLQYIDWIWAVLHGNLGTSISLQESVGPLVMTAFGNTMILLVAALFLATIAGVALGTLIALRPGSPLGRLVSGSSLCAISIPQYTVALLLLLFAVETGVLPTGGMHGNGSGGLGDLLAHLLLPALAAAVAPAGIVARMFSVALADVLSQDFVDAMRARGLKQAAIVRHAMHNALPSLLTITGLQLGYLLGGVLFVETIFDWPGIGQQVYEAISTRDMPLIQAGVLVSAVVLVLANVVVDAVHALIDPRVRA
jgi:peptide/nickel transport system permease protein